MRPLAFALFFFIAKFSFCQNNALPHIKPKIDNNKGILLLNFKENWKYHPGDNLDWAKPNYDDSQWHNISPFGLLANKMPDSLWQGYGWWRFSFTADSAVYTDMSRLFFESWGAAEIYLDGDKISEYGIFAKKASQEKNHITNYAADRNIKIKPNASHTLAIRFSNHQAKANFKILRKNSANLGFSIGFSNEIRGQHSDRRFANSFATFSVIAALLSVLFLLHFILFFKFKKHESNFIILLITALFLLAAFCAHALLFLPLNGLWNSIISNLLNSIAFATGYALLPYSLTLIFQLKQYQWLKHVLWLLLIRIVNLYFQLVPLIIFDGLLIFIIIVILSFLMFKAIKNNLPNVHYVTFGALGTSVFLLVNRLNSAGVIQLSTTFIYLDILLLYTGFPLGLYLYNTIQYGRLFAFMEAEVANRTTELNESVDNLQQAQVLLINKNVQIELLLKEIHHRVKNNLEVVSSLLALQSAKMDNPDMQEAMLASQNRVQSMGILHQKLYQSEHLAFIEMKNYFQNLAENILDSYNETNRILVKIDMPEIELDVDTAVPVGLIVNELLTNSLKYAFPNSKKGQIEISLVSADRENYTLNINDNGIGKTLNAKAKGTGFGTQLVNLLTRQIEGNLTEVNHYGTQISINFKRPLAA